MTRPLPSAPTRGRLLLAVLGALLLAAAPAQAQTPITVCASGCDHTSIQAAVDAATAGDIVEVGDGTYAENVVIDGKNLTLRSANGAASTTIEGSSGLGTVVVQGTTSGVTIGGTGQGLTLVGFDGPAGIETGALYVKGSHTNLDVVENELQANGEHGMIAEYGASLDGVTISGNTFSGTTYVGSEPGGCGFTTQFTTPNVPRQLVVLGNGGNLANPATVTNVTFTNNTLSGTAGGASTVSGCETFGQGNTLATLDVANSTISGNTFAGTTARWGASLRMRRPGVTVTGNTFNTGGLGLGNSIIFTQNNTTPIEAMVAANTLDQGAYADGGTTVAMSLQGAVNDAPSGGQVSLLPGLYVGQAFIDKDLTVTGDGLATTTLQAPTTLIECFATSTPKKPIVCVTDGATVDISDVTIDGAGNGNGNVQFMGLAFRNAGGSLTDAAVTDIRETPFSGNQHGVGIYSYNDDTIARAVTVSNVTVTGFQKNGFALNAADTTPLTVDVNNSTVTGAGLTAVTAQNAIQVYGRMISGTVSDNTVSGIAYDNTANPTKWVATSVLNFWSDVDLIDNTITGAQVGAYWYDGAGEISGNTVDVITAGNGGMWGIIATDPPQAVPAPFDAPEPTGVAALLATVASATLDVDVLDNDVTFVGGLNTNTVGLEADAGYGPNDLDVLFSNNRVSGFETGVSIYECASSCSTGVFVALAVTGNDLAGNGTGLTSNLATTVDAPGNFWGDADPSDDVSGLVDYSPWLGAAPGTTPQTVYTDDSIADAIALADAGDTIEVLAGTYAETAVVGESITLNGPNAGTAGDATRAAEATVTAVRLSAANATLDGFEVSEGTAILGQNAGVYVDDLDGISVLNNRLVHTPSGPADQGASYGAFRGIITETGGATTLTVEGNYATGWATGAYLNPGATGTVSGNVFDANFVGMSFDDAAGVTVSGNDFTGNPFEGIGIGVSATGLTVTGNDFVGNGTVAGGSGLQNYSADLLAAEGNWWGAASGPSGDGAGSGDAVFGSVDVDPWIGKAEPQTITQRNTPTTYSGGSAPATLTFSTLPSGGGSVSVATYPGLPAGVPAPPGAPIAFSIEMTSTMTNYDFEVEVSVDVSGIAGFGPDTRVGYYNASTAQWVLIDGTYAAGPPATFTFTTDHFTPFAFFNTPGTAYDVFVVTDPTDLGAGAAFPNDAWATTAEEPDDWSLNGAPTVEFFVAPEVGATFFSSSVTIEWDPAVLTYVSTDATGGLYDGADRTFFADATDAATGSLTVDGSRLDVANFTTSAGEYLAKVTFTVAAPGNSPVDLTGMRFRAYDGSSGQEDVYVTANGGELKAYLGDVATTGDASTGDGLVDFEDLTLFSGAYWSAAGDGSYKVKYDVGPTATNTVYGLPDEDGEVEFEDLVIFSISYGLSNTGVYPRRGDTDAGAPSAPVAVSVGAARADGGTVRVPVLVGEVSDLRALSVEVGFDAGAFELVGAARPAEGPFAGDAPALHLARATAGGAVADAATFGTLGVAGEGAALELVLRPTSGLASDYDGAEDVVTLAAADLRSTANAALPVAIAAPAAVVPDEFFVSPSYPNPARSTATLEYGLAEAGSVEIVVFDALGRRVLTLVDGEQEAGVHTATVDAGSLAPGLYVSVIRAGAHTATQRITVVR